MWSKSYIRKAFRETHKWQKPPSAYLNFKHILLMTGAWDSLQYWTPVNQGLKWQLLRQQSELQYNVFMYWLLLQTAVFKIYSMSSFIDHISLWVKWSSSVTLDQHKKGNITRRDLTVTVNIFDLLYTDAQKSFYMSWPFFLCYWRTSKYIPCLSYNMTYFIKLALRLCYTNTNEL